MALARGKPAIIAVVLAAFGLAVLASGWLYPHEEPKECCGSPDEPERLGKLGLVTSLPLYWADGADLLELAGGDAKQPWQREVLERRAELVPLDTLAADESASDRLADLDYLAVIQPRGLSPADNVALDDWVRAGGKLLLVLDPLLTGEYAAPLGDPRRPADTALIPPVVKRWGLSVQAPIHEVWEDGIFEVDLAGTSFTVSHGGTVVIADPAAASCQLHAGAVVARCAVGEGQVTLLADAAVFEDYELGGKDDRKLLGVLDFAFE